MADETIAPNEKDEVQWTIDNHPEIDSMAEEERGAIIDITARRLNPGGGEKPWGRKARQNDPNNPNLNTDAMTFLRPDGNFEIYDVISGVDGQATWDNHGVVVPGENGYWWPPNPVEDSGEGGGGGEGGAGEALVEDVEELQSQVSALQQQVADLQAQASGFETRLAALESQATQPFHCHGPVDLPIVVESLTRMRAKGDIDVAVKPGEAVPPTSSDEGWDPVDTVMLKRLLDRLRGDEETPPAAGV